MLNSNEVMSKMGVIENNNYSTIEVIEEKTGSRILSINNSYSSKYSPDSDSRFDYIKYVENNFINLKQKTKSQKKSILVIGAGGFTIGVDDSYNEYVFLDIDKSLKKVAENHFLKKPLGKNKIFIAESARSFLRRNKEKYDIIFVDAYSNKDSIPSDLITKEFFEQVKGNLKERGIAAFNIIASPNFQSRYSVKMDNTMRLVFGNINRHVFGDYDGFSGGTGSANLLYSYFGNKAGFEVYSDDKNSYFLDKN